MPASARPAYVTHETARITVARSIPAAVRQWDGPAVVSGTSLEDAVADDYDKRHGDEGSDWHRLLVEPAAHGRFCRGAA